MPSQEYCEKLLEKENEQLEDAQDALDDYNEALDEQGSAAEGTMGSAAKAGGHGLDGSWGDVWADVVDMFKGKHDFGRATEKAERARGKWEREERKREALMRKWCEECGEPPDPDMDEPEDPDGEHGVDFDESEVPPIIGHPGGRGWD